MSNKEITNILLSNAHPHQTPAGRSGMAWQDGDYLAVYRQDDGYYYFFHGIAGGNAYEGDDVGPYDNVEDAIADALAFLEEKGELDAARRLTDYLNGKTE